MGEGDELRSGNDAPKERVTSDHEPVPSDGEDSEVDEVADFDTNLFLSTKDRIRLLLLLATKRRHNLTYSAAEDLMALTDVLSEQENPLLPTRHIMKSVIDKYSCALTVHHVCPQCDLYIGILSTSVSCSSCTTLIVPDDNKKKGFYFVYLSLHDQLKSLLENTYKNILKFRGREKINFTNYEDINDGKFYKAIVEQGQISFNFFVDGVQVGFFPFPYTFCMLCLMRSAAQRLLNFVTDCYYQQKFSLACSTDDK